MVAKVLSVFVSLLLVFTFVPGLGLAEEADLFYYKCSESSSNASLWYSIGGNGLQELKPGEEISAPKGTSVSFYVRAKNGYANVKNFKQQYGSNAYDSSGWINGNYLAIDGALSNGTKCLSGHEEALNSAVEEGCSYKFWYSDASVKYRYREFKITGEYITVNVSYDASDETGTYVHSNVADSPYDSVIVLPQPDEMLDGRTFYGWVLNVNGKIYDTAYAANSEVSIDSIWQYLEPSGTSVDISFVALWEDKVSLTYNSNGATGGSSPVVDKNLYDKGSKVQVKENSWTYFGKDFAGWEYEGKLYSPGDYVTLDRSVELKAVWVDRGFTRINYAANEGGSVVLVSGANEEYELVNETNLPLGCTAVADEGYEFVNWTDEDGNEVSVEETFVPLGLSGSYWANFKKINIDVSHGTDANDMSETGVSGMGGESINEQPTSEESTNEMSETNKDTITEDDAAIITDPSFIEETVESISSISNYLNVTNNTKIVRKISPTEINRANDDNLEGAVINNSTEEKLESSVIEDSSVPLAYNSATNLPHNCILHLIMLAGILFTLTYGVIVTRKRAKEAEAIGSEFNYLKGF
jgi:hypothetical protein